MTSHRPIRLAPGEDLRRALEHLAPSALGGAAFVVAGIGSLSQVSLRFAAAEHETHWSGPFEIVSLSGSLSADGAHLHMTVSDASGRVSGGHVGYGNTIRTTAELLLVALQGWDLSRVPDPQTGHAELLVRRSGDGRR